MSYFPCSRADELAAELKAGHLQDAWDPSLREHVENCRHCSDVIVVTQALKGARSESVESAHIPSPSMLWWRAQLRRRNEALERISKPTSWVGRFALLSTLLVALVLLVGQVQQIGEWLRRLTGITNSHTLSLGTQSPSSAWSVVLMVLTFGALALLGGYIVYLATEKG